MLELIQRILIGHAHRWEVINRVEVWDTGTMPDALILTQKCTIYGKLHNHRISNSACR